MDAGPGAMVDRLHTAVSTGAVSGAIAVAVDASGARITSAGCTRPHDGVDVCDRTRFRLASCSKPVTALAALMAVQEGLLALDAPVRAHLPEFSIGSRFDGDPGTEITIRHLLSHMAGLTRQAPIDNSYHRWDEHIASIGDTWLRFPVGARYAYSDIGVDLVGRVLEMVSGEPFPAFVARRVFDPLGMDDATFDPAIVKADAARAVGHIDGRPHGMSGMVPAGSLYASGRDLAHLLAFVLAGGAVDGRRLVNAELWDTWSTVPFPVPGQDEGYALGLRTRRTPAGWAHGHAGSGFGFLADLWWLPERGVGGAVVVNSHDDDIRGTVVPALVDALPSRASGITAPYPARNCRMLDERPDERLDDGEEPDHNPDGFAGTYVGGLRDTLRFETRDGDFGVTHGARFEPLAFEAPDTACTVNGAHEQYRFVDDASATKFVVRVRDGENWTYNDGPGDPPGPDWPDWDAVLGDYTVVTRDSYRGRVPVTKREGYVTVGSQRVLEHRGHFFTSRGEAVLRDGERLRVGRFTLQRASASRAT
jgi:CubicO group peptidase (beta-lactamase class C family)